MKKWIFVLLLVVSVVVLGTHVVDGGSSEEEEAGEEVGGDDVEEEGGGGGGDDDDNDDEEEEGGDDDDGGGDDDDDDDEEEEEEGDDDDDDSDDDDEDEEEEGDDDDDDFDDDDEDEEEEGDDDDDDSDDDDEDEEEEGDDDDDDSDDDEGDISDSTDTLKYNKKCKRGGLIYQPGETFTDPNDNCRTCTCCKTGVIRCKVKDCAENRPPCGIDHFETITEECCPVCSEHCEDEAVNNIQCRSKTCPGPNGTPYYPDNSCCQSCGCSWRGKVVPEGPITTSPTAACEGCVCQNGTVNCTNEAPCPAQRLKCVNPEVFDSPDNCTWHCPNGPTCFRGNELIMPNTYHTVGDKVCFCYTDWYPLAFCANKDHWGSVEERLHVDKCMKRPADLSFWTS